MTKRKGFDFDPDYPNRPVHPDFKLLSDLLVAYDDKGSGGVDAQLAQLGGADVNSIFYMAAHRAELAEQRMKDQDPVARLAAAWIDGFMLAAQFTREKMLALTDASTQDGSRRTGEKKP